MKNMYHRYVLIRQRHDGIEAVSLMITLVVAVMVIGIIWVLLSHAKVASIDRITADVIPVSGGNTEYADGIIYQVNASQSGKVQLTLKVIDTEGKGAVSASVEVSGPDLSKLTYTTDNFGKVTCQITFKLTSSASDFITIKATKGQSSLGGDATLQIPVHPK